VQTLIRLTERYCVVYQTLAHPPQLTMTVGRRQAPDNRPHARVRLPGNDHGPSAGTRPARPEPGEIPTLNPSGGTIVSGGRGWHRKWHAWGKHCYHNAEGVRPRGGCSGRA